MPLTYGSVCSGMCMATQAWAQLGWKAEFFSEIEKFPCHVLAHRYGSNLPGERLPASSNGIPNYGDMNDYQEWLDHGPNSERPIDLLVGGTPCQTYSIAGLRAGLDDARGNLMLTFAAIARRYWPGWVVWENVPGVLSSNGGLDFASLLGLLTGKRITVPGRWKNSGYGTNGYGVAWRVLDAQYARVDGFERAVPQRRRRLFVVGYLGDWRRAAAVLFERESMQGNPAPRRKAGKEVAGTISSRTTGGGGLGTDFELSGGLVADEVSHCLNAGGMGRRDWETESFVAFSSKDYGADASENLSPTLRSGNADKIHANGGVMPAIAFKPSHYTRGKDGAPSEVVPPLSADADKGDQDPVIAYGFENRARGDDGRGYARPPNFSKEIAPTIGTVKPPAVAFALTSGMAASASRMPQEQGALLPEMALADNRDWAVRRLTPIECERLQGCEDDFTRIPWNGKPAEQCPDGPRYKVIGNSMAKNVMMWLGMRIEMVEELVRSHELGVPPINRTSRARK